MSAANKDQYTLKQFAIHSDICGFVVENGLTPKALLLSWRLSWLIDE